MRDPGVESVNGVHRAAAATEHRPHVRLAEAARASARSRADQVIARLRGKLAHVPGATLFLQPVQDLRVGGRPSAAQYQYTLQRRRPRTSSSSGRRSVLAELRTLPELTDVNSDQQNQRPAGVARRSTATTAARLGITPQLIDDTLYDAFGQRQVSTMYTPLNQYHVVMEVEPQFWQNPDGLQSHLRALDDGRAWCRSRAFTRYEPDDDAAGRQPPGPVPVGHDLVQPGAGRGARRRPSTRSSGRSAEHAAAGERSAAASRARRRRSRPRSPTSRILIAAALADGLHRARRSSTRAYIHPLTILSTLPSAGVGALLALLLTQNELSRDRADRHHPADRHREEERDPDDRLRARGRAHERARRPRTRSTRPACCGSGRSR